jgi:hypothetical protein
VAGELEADSVALERIREYEALPQEREWKTDFPLSKVKHFKTCISMTNCKRKLYTFNLSKFLIGQYLQDVLFFPAAFALHK